MFYYTVDVCVIELEPRSSGRATGSSLQIGESADTLETVWRALRVARLAGSGGDLS